MKKRKRFLLDVDGILADFVQAAVKVMSDISGKTIMTDDVKQWEVTEVLESHEMREFCKQAFCSAGFCSSLEIYDGAQAAVEEIRKYCDLYFVTAPMHKNPTWMPERVKWLQTHFGVDPNHVCFVYDKFIVEGDIMLDDSSRNLIGWKDHHNPDRVALFWNRPYNLTEPDQGLIRVDSWDKVFEHVRKIAK